MPVSEDEFERPLQMGPSPAPLSKAEQRKNNKPIMEKRRRARINHCLNELKTLILDAMKKDPARHSKLEKADILEMTVKHLQQIQRQQLTAAVATDPGVIMRFKSGFDECAAEVSRYISRLDGVDNGVKQRLTAHLHRCVSGLQHVTAFPNQNVFAAGLAQGCDKSSGVLAGVPAMPGDVNNNSNQNGERIQIPGGLHLIPSRLPTGELALLVPNSNHMSTFLNGPAGATFHFPANATVNLSSVLSPPPPPPAPPAPLGGNLGANHPSAFTAVSKGQEYPSPTSTADIIIKKEPTFPEKEDYKSSGQYFGRGPDHPCHRNYTFKVTETKDFQMEDGDSVKNYRRFNGFDNSAAAENGDGDNGETVQKATSTCLQKNVADSTTSCTQSKSEDFHESGFKPFQVEIPNSHLKAHISISRSPSENNLPQIQVYHKPNPNLTMNPNKLSQKPLLIFPRSPAPDPHPLKKEPFSGVVKSEEPNETTIYSGGGRGHLPSSAAVAPDSAKSNPKSTEGRYYYKNGTRTLSPEPFPTTTTTSSFSSEEPFLKVAKICLDATPTEGHHHLQSEATLNRCKRVSVIVEDSSKSSTRENAREVSASPHKDMWRPW